ncbi:hypothetical protein THICB3180033 [Thiomonas sp. CB3]|nr:hypothetical protein THICB3180033 [Thiomonas sp. CB3]
MRSLIKPSMGFCSNSPAIPIQNRHRRWRGDRPTRRVGDEADFHGGRLVIGLSGHWPTLVGTTAMVCLAVAEVVSVLSGCFQRWRVGAVDPLQPLGVATTRWPVSA